MSNGLYKGEFFNYFGGLKDTRQKGKTYHRLTDILFVVTCGILCGYDEWDDIYEWASAPLSQEWLKKYIALRNGMPSLSTIKRGLAIIKPKEFSIRFGEWMAAMLNLPSKDVISLDGKTSKGSKDKSKEQRALHIVSALCHSYGMVIGQTRTDEKSNEITAIPELLDQLLIEGCIVTIDAMGAQKKIAKKIVQDNKADYVINLKGNQGTLHEDVKDYFEELEHSGDLEKARKQAQKGKLESLQNPGLSVYSTLEKGHGRIEKRTYFYETDLDWMETRRDWEKLTGIGKVVREVEYLAEPTKKTIETAYYIGSVDNVHDFAVAARNHWGVESMHWSLDVTFGDDHNRTQEAAAAQNLTIVKRMVFNVLKNEVKVRPKTSKPNKRIVAATDPAYRDLLINLAFNES